jgi:hypothetical protein
MSGLWQLQFHLRIVDEYPSFPEPVFFSLMARLLRPWKFHPSRVVIPAPYQMRGWLSQARNDNPGKETFDRIHHRGLHAAENTL